MATPESFRFSTQSHHPDCQSTVVVDSSDLDTSLLVTPENIQRAATAVIQQMQDLGFDLGSLSHACTESNLDAVEIAVEKIEKAASILYVQWEIARRNHSKIQELAIARLFNGILKDARQADARHQLFDKRHIQFLGNALTETSDADLGTKTDKTASIVMVINSSAKARVHELSWPWVMLPTFPQQHYGRILLLKVPSHDERFPTFITQTTFLAGEGTQFHTHGQNWAFARPLGSRNNIHINSLWEPNSTQQIFPLRHVNKAYYDSNDVVVIPPRAIHSIYGARKPVQELLDFATLRQNLDYIDRYTDEVKFGENSCMHVYRPDWQLVEEFKYSPLVQKNSTFFVENDMFVFDHLHQKIWSGRGGAWARRMMTYGPEGEHCGACFTENDPRQENIDSLLVAQWYALSQAPKLITYHFD